MFMRSVVAILFDRQRCPLRVWKPMLPPTAQPDPMWALVVAIIYFGSSIAFGFAAKVAIDWLMGRWGVDLDDIHEQAGPNRGSREVFLLGAWRTED